ncbi:potassium channel protein [Ktedonosporobacter rubrisoli]|uniref:Potassium channel protein n=1 Tax=Ktedonosporobacter rubrisoli TaxID=2509675 RepID=A0A4P6JJF4_KTERU|nr:potassium channel family protein [Ktedonosporobacter rubrisoli]QBD75229.1 potassium channel protein [Ktedonosporobacter rubrisoli]
MVKKELQRQTGGHYRGGDVATLLKNQFMQTSRSFRHLRVALVLVLGVVILGTSGYMYIEGLPFTDALYTTIGMMATVGDKVQPLSARGRLFTIGLIVLGVSALLYLFGATMEFLIEGHFSQAVKRRIMDKKIAGLRNHYVICGFGRVGTQIARDLEAQRAAFVVIDENEQSIQRSIQAGYFTVQGDATSDEWLRKIGIHHARALFVATDSDAHNISITLSARHLNNTLFIVARANHNETEAKLQLAGANRVLSPYTTAGRRMANLALQADVT